MALSLSRGAEIASPRASIIAFPALAALRQHAGGVVDKRALAGTLTALLRQFDEAEPRLVRLHAATLSTQGLPARGERLADEALWVEWCGAGSLLAEGPYAPCAALFSPIATGPYRGALAATMVGVAKGLPFTFPGAVLVEPGVYVGNDSVTDHMRASYGLPTVHDAKLDVLTKINRQIALLEGEYLVAAAGAPAALVAYNCRKPSLPEHDKAALRTALMATAVLRPEADALLTHSDPLTQQTAERAADHLAEYGPAAALRLLRAVGAGNTVH